MPSVKHVMFHQLVELIRNIYIFVRLFDLFKSLKREINKSMVIISKHSQHCLVCKLSFDLEVIVSKTNRFTE